MVNLTTLSTDDITITVDDEVSVANVVTLNGVTAVNLDLAGGVSDIAANYSTLLGAQTAGLTLIAAQDNTATLKVTDAVNMLQFVDLDAASDTAINLAGGISDTADNLMSDDGNTAVTAFTNARTQKTDVAVNITDAPTVAQLNAIGALTTGKITAAISGNVADLVGITTEATDDITITVDDAATIAQTVTLDGVTAVNLDLAGGISDTAIRMMSTDGNTAVTAFTTATNQDTNVNLEITGTNATVAQLNAIAGAVGGKVTADISGNVADLVNLTTLSTDDITITVDDAAASSTVIVISSVDKVVKFTKSATLPEISAVTLPPTAPAIAFN